MFGYKSNSRLKKWIAKKLILQYDSLVFIGRELREDVIQSLSIPKSTADRKFFHSDWGADREFYKKYEIPKLPGQTGFAVTAGKTDRDFETIVEAFREIDFQLKIYCTLESMPQNKNIPKNVIICTTGISYTDLLKEYNDARVILIPLKKHRGGTQGQTSLIDVFAMGKPVVMTYNKNIDFDLEKEGIGYWTEQDNVQSWRTALNRMLHDEKTLEEMGAKSMKIFKERCNSEIFAEQLEAIFIETELRTKK
jgi:glycosyltransferase involved in cell wall biosynthesis